MIKSNFTFTGDAVSGWCVDLNSNVPSMVRLYVDDIFLREGRADMPRPDAEEQTGRIRGGFYFPISENVAELLPDKGLVRVETVAGEVLQPAEEISERICATQSDGAELRKRLASGWVIDKWGDLKLPFRAAPENREKFLQLYVEMNKIFYDIFGQNLFLHYGSLLGFVREGKLLDHDEDVDSSYVIYVDTPEGAARHFHFVLATLEEIKGDFGFTISVTETGQMSLWKGDVYIDIFTSWITSDKIMYTYFGVGGDLNQNHLSLRQAELHGFTVIVPDQSEHLLELTYGPSWRIPDPAFQWHIPSSVKLAVDGMRAAGKEKLDAYRRMTLAQR